ncbi:MAG: hypothetical protein IT204_18840 [Fimbriimonadaceae bacterium]|nr:hypothetical protein [Fimbriimonadaceae bacterium]
MKRALLWLWLAWPAAAQTPVSIMATATPATCAVGDRLQYRAEVLAEGGVTGTIEAEPPHFGGFDVLGDPQQEQTLEGPRTRFVFVFNLRASEAGNQTIAPFAAAYLDPTSHSNQRAEGPPVTVRVTAAPTAAGGELRPAKPPVALPDASAPYRAAALLAAAGIAVTLLAMGAARWWHGRRRSVLLPPAPAPPPAHQLALQQLRELAAAELPPQGLVDQYCTRLSLILREFLGARYEFYASESTTTEILATLLRGRAPGAVLEASRAVLAGCDQVKFAEGRPTVEDCRQLLIAGQALVELAAGVQEGPWS